MVLTKVDLDEAFATQNEVLKKNLDTAMDVQKKAIEKLIEESINSIRAEIMGKLVDENKKLGNKICVLENKVVELEKSLESNLQYQRKSNVLISGIPA